MTQIFAYGRLGADPVERQTRSGKPMATASLAAEVGGSDEGKPETLWLGVVAFGRVADDLLRCRKGELLSVGGRLQLNKWTDAQGVEHERLQVVAASLAGARTVRPRGGKRSNGQASTPACTSAARPPYADDRDDGLLVSDDDLPF